ncbi:MAG: hypothetical protein Salg2KO_01500 [Salibacteraceae bacterium]
MRLKNIYNLVAVSASSLILISCSPDPQSPGVEYMPDMYRTPALEPYSAYDGGGVYGNGMEARDPADGSIPRGYLPYGIPNTADGYAMAGELLKNPYPMTDEIIGEGKVIYTKYCIQCHGKEGNGDGPTVTAGGHPPPPAYTSAALKNLPEGKMFHTITYGKNLMGSHASQLDNEMRWKVIRYVQTLQNPDAGEDSTNEPADGEKGEMESMDETAMNN